MDLCGQDTYILYVGINDFVWTNDIRSNQNMYNGSISFKVLF